MCALYNNMYGSADVVLNINIKAGKSAAVYRYTVLIVNKFWYNITVLSEIHSILQILA